MVRNMRQVAIIACARWKGEGYGTEFAHLPAPFLPLGDGSTCASRLSAQLRALGYDVALTVGPLGYPFRAYQPRHGFCLSPQYADESGEEYARAIGVDPDDTPWTDAMHRYARKLGTLVAVGDPGWKTKHASYSEALERIGSAYERFVLVRGDKLYDARFLQRLLETLPWSCQFSFDVYHSLFLLDWIGASCYHREAQGHLQRSTSKSEENWGLQMSRQPDGGEGTGRLGRAGITHYSWHTPPWNQVERQGLWFDVDEPHGYAEAKRQIARGSTVADNPPALDGCLLRRHRDFCVSRGYAMNWPEHETERQGTGEEIVRNRGWTPHDRATWPSWYRWDGGWYEADGQRTRYHVWPLTAQSVVVEAGTYEGAWAVEIAKRYGCTVHTFEPAPRAYKVAQQHLQAYGHVHLYPLALGSSERKQTLGSCNNDGASLTTVQQPIVTVQVVDAAAWLREQGIENVDLMAVNIEGGEFELLQHLINQGNIEQIQRLMIQWHPVGPVQGEAMFAIQAQLAQTHAMLWNHGAWEAWGVRA